MIDMLPTILDLLDLPQPEVMQGRSLAPFLLQEADWEPSPIIFDEFYVNATSGKLLGSIEVVDGRWGASLEIVQEPEEDERPPGRRRPVPLLVYDLWNDPGCLRSLHEERPDLVEKYSEFLLEQFEVHQALAQQFTRGEDSPLDAEQLETLRTLGYIE
jgi:arylsulfatase A-like enzyme